MHKLFNSLLDGIAMATSKARPLHGTPSPSAWICRFLPLLPPGARVLDLACGNGRHLRLLHALNYRVTGVDRDLSGLRDLAATQDVELLERDLEDGSPFPLVRRQFEGVIVTNYLHRPLLPSLVDLVAPDGLLLYETFAMGNENFGRPGNPAFLLRPGELLDAVQGRLQVVAYEHGEVGVPKPGVLQRIAARRTPPVAR